MDKITETKNLLFIFDAEKHQLSEYHQIAQELLDKEGIPDHVLDDLNKILNLTVADMVYKRIKELGKK